MATAYGSGTVPADADAVWQVVRDFNGLAGWHPAIDRSEIESGGDVAAVGCIRKLTLGDGNLVRERLVSLDDTDRCYTYDILESPFAVRSYRSTIRVAPVTASGQTFVEWWSHFDADGTDEPGLARTFRDDIYTAGIAGLAERFNQ